MKTQMSRFQIHDDLTAPEGSLPVLRGALNAGGQLPNFLGVLADEPPAAAADPDADMAQPTGTRRTVVVTGRPGHLGVPRADLERRRPPRTVAERLGGSPDRVVGWAVGLGFILILIAILTAGGA